MPFFLNGTRESQSQERFFFENGNDAVLIEKMRNSKIFPFFENGTQESYCQDCFFFENMTPNFRPLENLYKSFSFNKKEVTNFSGGSGLLSTANDYLKFAELLLNDGKLRGISFLPERVVKKIKTNSLADDIASIGVKSFAQMSTNGMGHSLAGSVIIDPNIAFPSNIHDFGWGGMGSNYFWIDFTRQICAIFMTQLIPSSAYPNRKELKALLS